MIILLMLWCMTAEGGPGITRRIVLDPLDQTTVVLPDSFVILDSFEVVGDSTVMVQGLGGYSIHAFRSEVILPPNLIGDVVEITYRYLPLGIGRTFRNREKPSPFMPVEVTRIPASGPVTYNADLSGERDISIAGTKTIGVRVGSQQDPTLNQSLNVQLVGSIAGDIEVNARLSDENSPIQPEGTSAQLKDLDEIVIDLKRKDDQLSIGDCAVRLSDFKFLSLERKMQGLSGVVNHNGWNSSFALATSKGEFGSIEFLGQEGKQGPYYLGDELAASGISEEFIVLAGTERIWIDGVRVSRGIDRDYTIDYATGAVIFTERHLITDQSRIAVDFQYTRERYRRTVYTATITGTLTEYLSVRSGWFSESDDADRTLGWDLTKDERSILERAGDDPQSAAIPSYQFVGFGNGDYDTLHVRYLIPDEAGTWSAVFDSVGQGNGAYRLVGSDYEYYGPGNGEYEVRAESTGVGSYTIIREIILISDFLRMRQEEHTSLRIYDHGIPQTPSGSFTATFYRKQGGDYIRASQSLWSYVGPGHGDFSLYRTVPVPRSQDTFVAGVALNYNDRISVSVEGAALRRDSNTLSDIDDEDNNTGAFDADISLNGTELLGLPNWRLNGRFKGQSKGFVSPGRLKPVDWSRSWLLEEDERQAQHESSVDIHLGLPDEGNVEITVGELAVGGRIDRRFGASTDIRAPYGIAMRGRYNRSARKGNGDLLWWTEGTISRDKGFLGPIFRWKAETVESPGVLSGKAYRGEGFSEMGYGLRLGADKSRTMTFIGGIRTYRNRGEDASAWVDSRKGTWIEVGGVGGSGRKFRASVDFKFAESKPISSNQGIRSQEQQKTTRNTVGAIRINTSPGRAWPSLDIVYKASGREQEVLTESLVPEESFETNVGEYDSLGNWVGVKTGTHKKILIPSGNGEQVGNVEGNATLRLRTDPSSSSLFRRMISSDTSIRVQASSRAVNRYEMYLFDPRILADDSLTVNERIRIEERVELNPVGSPLRIGFQWVYDLNKDNRRIDRRLRGTSNQHVVRIRCPGIVKGNAELRIGRTTENESEIYRDEGGSTLTNDTVRYTAVPSISTPVYSRIEVLFSGIAERETVHQRQGLSESRDAIISIGALTPGIRYSFPERGNILIESEFRRTRISGPWEQMSGLLRRRDEAGAGVNLRVSGNYRLQKSLILSLNVLYGKTPLQGTVSEGSMELVATF